MPGMAKVIDRLETCPTIAVVINSSTLDRATAEGILLKPHLANLNHGQASWGGLSSIRFEGGTAGPNAETLRASAEFVYEWLQKTNSVLRGLIVYLSSGGVFYAAHCHEKVLRAFVEHGGGDKAAFVRAALARPSVAASSVNELAALGA